MLIKNLALRWCLVGLLVVLVIPLLVMLGIMVAGVAGMAMSGMMGNMSVGMMTLCGLWSALVAGALIFLMVLLTRKLHDPEQYRRASGHLDGEIDEQRAA